MRITYIAEAFIFRGKGAGVHRTYKWFHGPVSGPNSLLASSTSPSRNQHATRQHWCRIVLSCFLSNEIRVPAFSNPNISNPWKLADVCLRKGKYVHANLEFLAPKEPKGRQ